MYCAFFRGAKVQNFMIGSTRILDKILFPLTLHAHVGMT